MIETNRLIELEGIGAEVAVNITIFQLWRGRHVPRILVDELDWTRSARSVLQVPERRPGGCHCHCAFHILDLRQESGQES
jgi:hypothetical protein